MQNIQYKIQNAKCKIQIQNTKYTNTESCQDAVAGLLIPSRWQCCLMLQKASSGSTCLLLKIMALLLWVMTPSLWTLWHFYLLCISLYVFVYVYVFLYFYLLLLWPFKTFAFWQAHARSRSVLNSKCSSCLISILCLPSLPPAFFLADSV